MREGRREGRREEWKKALDIIHASPHIMRGGVRVGGKGVYLSSSSISARLSFH